MLYEVITEPRGGDPQGLGRDRGLARADTARERHDGVARREPDP